MIKVLIPLASLLVLCAGQLNNLTHTQELDPTGNFQLNWEVIIGTGDIVLEIQAKAAGWVQLGIVTDDGKYADVIFGGYNDQFNFGYVEVNVYNFFLTHAIHMRICVTFSYSIISNVRTGALSGQLVLTCFPSLMRAKILSCKQLLSPHPTQSSVSSDRSIRETITMFPST